MYSKILYIGIIVSLFCSCKKGEKKEYAAEPSIEFLSISPSSMTEGEQNVVINIKYTDGDGDLGENSTDVKNMFVTDSRLGITYSFRIQELAPRGQAIPITGTLNADIGTVFITDNSAQQTTNFSIYIVDRAGHVSNTVTTSPLTIHAQ